MVESASPMCDMDEQGSDCAAKAASSRQACCKYASRSAGSVAAPRERCPQPVASSHTHFFKAACQLITTVNAALACAGTVGIRNLWPSALTSQRCPLSEMPPAQIGGANNT